MAEDVKDEAVKETEPAVEEKAAEGEVEPEVEGEKHPLAPGGVRFEQVYRERKELEVERDRLAAEKARLEAEVAAARKPAETAPRQYTDDELDALEEDARARGDRTTIHAVQNYRIDRRARAIVEEREKVALRSQLHTTVTGALMQGFPALGDPNSDLFRAAATEFAGLSTEYVAKGLDIASDPHATELAVGRALRKNPELVKKYAGGSMPKPKQAEVTDTHVETGEGSPPKAAERGPKLTQRELDFCRRSNTDPKEYAKHKVQRAARG